MSADLKIKVPDKEKMLENAIVGGAAGAAVLFRDKLQDKTNPFWKRTIFTGLATIGGVMILNMFRQPATATPPKTKSSRDV